MYKRYIKEKDWQKIYETFKRQKGIRVGSVCRTRRFIEGVYCIMRTRAQWRELPDAYGKWRSLHKRYEAWCRKRIWNLVLQEFSKDYDKETIIIDTIFIRIHPCAAGYKKNSQDQEALGRSKGGVTTKIHAVGDALGQALCFTLTPGQRMTSPKR